MRHSAREALRLASVLDADLRALPVRNTQSMRAVRRAYSRRLGQAPPEFILHVARNLLRISPDRWIAYELIENHASAFALLGEVELEELGQGLDSWWTADAFARTLAGPAWLNGQVSDALIRKWARSGDCWWRRAALVSTVALNVRSHGGPGDPVRTLRVCHLLVKDHDDMVVKAMSWALRELVVHDPRSVQEFLDRHDTLLAGRVKREVKNKLRTGLKAPRRRG